MENMMGGLFFREKSPLLLALCKNTNIITIIIVTVVNNIYVIFSLLFMAIDF